MFSTRNARGVALILPVVVSAVLVFWNFTGLGLSYWDEYNYVVTAEWFLGKSGAVFHTYETPMFPFFMSMFFWVFGIRDFVAIATSGFFAVLTVAMVGLAGAKMLGLKVGVVAPILLVLTPYFLVFSRVAVTDMTFTFFFTAAELAAFYAITSGKLSHHVLAGVLFAICAGVKYSGVLALLVPTAYMGILVVRSRRGLRLRAGLRYSRAFLLMLAPSVLGAFLFVSFLGVGGSLRQLTSGTGLEELTLGLPQTFARGVDKFMALSWSSHSSQLNVIPLRSAMYYVQLLATWGSIPVLVLAIIGVLTISLKRQPELFTLAWASVVFIEFSSIEPYLREMLPLMPPLSILAVDRKSVV